MHKCDFGIVISASHNPANYNGIKVFDSDGHKISKEMEKLIESHLGMVPTTTLPTSSPLSLSFLPITRRLLSPSTIFPVSSSEGGVLGGEGSGHTLILGESTTGDGVQTAVVLAKIMEISLSPSPSKENVTSYCFALSLNKCALTECRLLSCLPR